MATIYVNLTQSAGGALTNGYGYGDDARSKATAASKSTPVATLTRAISVSASTDIIVINDGTYVEATNYYVPNKSNLTINSETRHGAILRQNGGQFRVFHVTGSGTGLTIGEVVIDGANDANNCLTTGTSESSITFSGTKFLNPTASFLDLTLCSDLAIDSNWVANATSLTSHGFRHAPTGITAGTASITNGTMVVDAISSGKTCILYDPQVAGVSGVLSGTSITVNGASGSISGVSSTGLASLSVSASSLSMIGAATHIGIAANNDALDVMDTCSIINNAVASANAGSGLGIVVGKDADTDANANRITAPQVSGNTVTKFNHGLLFGHITDGKLFSNSTTDNILGIVLKATTTCESTGNIVTDATGSGALRFKGDTNSIHANNLVIYTNGASVSAAKAIYSDAAGAVNSTGCGIYNNCIYADETIADWTDSIVGSTGTYNSNNYYATANGGADAVPYNYAGAGFATLALWNGSATVSNETEINPELDAKNIARSTALIGGGFRWWAGANPVGANGEPFSDFDTDIGANQSTLSPFHPVNL